MTGRTVGELLVTMGAGELRRWQIHLTERRREEADAYARARAGR